MAKFRTGIRLAQREPHLQLLVAAVFLLIGLGAASPLAAQRAQLSAGAGIAVPTWSAAEQRSAGPHALVAIDYRLSSWFGLRLEYTATLLDGKPHMTDNPSDASRGDLLLHGPSLSLLFRLPTAARTRPYVFLSGGVYPMNNLGGVENPYGRVGGASFGAGLEGELGRFGVFAQSRLMVVFSDFGALEWLPTTYVPLTAGLRTPCCGLPGLTAR